MYLVCRARLQNGKDQRHGCLVGKDFFHERHPGPLGRFAQEHYQSGQKWLRALDGSWRQIKTITQSEKRPTSRIVAVKKFCVLAILDPNPNELSHVSEPSIMSKVAIGDGFANLIHYLGR